MKQIVYNPITFIQLTNVIIQIIKNTGTLMKMKTAPFWEDGLGQGGRVGDFKSNIRDCLQPSANTETKKYPGIFCLF